MLVKKDDYEHFYYNAGLYMGYYCRNWPITIRKKAIDEFKKFVEDNGGVEHFLSSKDAVTSFIGEIEREICGA